MITSLIIVLFSGHPPPPLPTLLIGREEQPRNEASSWLCSRAQRKEDMMSATLIDDTPKARTSYRKCFMDEVTWVFQLN